jgi:hypothetical protein
MDEGIVGDIAEVLDVGFEAPVPIVLEEKFVMIEFSATISSGPIFTEIHLP